MIIQNITNLKGEINIDVSEKNAYRSVVMFIYRIIDSKYISKINNDLNM